MRKGFPLLCFLLLIFLLTLVKTGENNTLKSYTSNIHSLQDFPREHFSDFGRKMITDTGPGNIMASQRVLRSTSSILHSSFLDFFTATSHHRFCKEYLLLSNNTSQFPLYILTRKLRL